MAKRLHSFHPPKLMVALAYGWLFLPFVLFSFGWMKVYISIPLVAAVVFCFVRMVKNAPDLWVPKIDKITLLKIGVVAGIVLFWVYYSGIGRYSYQNEDQLARNGILRVLVEQPWPIIDMNPPQEYFTGPVAFVYYFGFWLLPALVGKVFGLPAGYFAQYLWAVLGILLVYWLILAATVKRMAIWPLVVFILFSGLDVVASSLMRGHLVNVITATPHLDNWADYFQYSSFTTQLYWVFNQALAGWMATLLLFLQKKNHYMAMIVGVTLISSTLPGVGAIPLALCFALRNWQEQHPGKGFFPNPAGFIRDVLTPENFIGLAVGLISYMFLGSNNAGQRFSTLFHMTGELLLLWLLFVVCEVLLYFALLFKYERKNFIFWVLMGLFLLFPWLRVGGKADLSMRSSIPALMILYLMVIMALDRSWREKSRALFAGLVAVLLVGTATAETEIIRGVAMTRIYRSNGTPIAAEEWAPMEVSWRDNFYGIIEDKLFFRLFSR